MDAIVITGVSSGIGLRSAEILCESGYKVYGSVRKKRMQINFVINILICLKLLSLM